MLTKGSVLTTVPEAIFIPLPSGKRIYSWCPRPRVRVHRTANRRPARRSSHINPHCRNRTNKLSRKLHPYRSFEKMTESEGLSVAIERVSPNVLFYSLCATNSPGSNGCVMVLYSWRSLYKQVLVQGGALGNQNQVSPRATWILKGSCFTQLQY